MKNTISKITDIQSIPNYDYEGYLWYSDANQPEIFEGKKFTPDQLTTLPFVVEGMLYAAKEKVSIRIVNIDGAYRISKVTLDNIPKELVTEYFAKKEFGEFIKIKMYQHWEEKEDIINNNRPVLSATWSAFIGFKK
ncbi:TIGR04423 family type III CRISPR-associated protein [bacterium]|nr:TIGR04423 family type III CRISPR-associated protein [bacterium]